MNSDYPFCEHQLGGRDHRRESRMAIQVLQYDFFVKGVAKGFGAAKGLAIDMLVGRELDRHSFDSMAAAAAAVEEAVAGDAC